MATPNTPSVVSHIWLIALLMLAPYQRIVSGRPLQLPKKT
jgi:hypothetical protein